MGRNACSTDFRRGSKLCLTIWVAVSVHGSQFYKRLDEPDAQVENLQLPDWKMQASRTPNNDVLGVTKPSCFLKKRSGTDGVPPNFSREEKDIKELRKLVSQIIGRRNLQTTVTNTWKRGKLLKMFSSQNLNMMFSALVLSIISC